jgi:hypothetical protein
MKITLNDLDEEPCERYSYLYDKYSMQEEFDALEEIKENNKHDDIACDISDLSWLIGHCKKLQTLENFHLFLSMRPDNEYVELLSINCQQFVEWYEKQQFKEWYEKKEVRL